MYFKNLIFNFLKLLYPFLLFSEALNLMDYVHNTVLKISTFLFNDWLLIFFKLLLYHY